MKCPKCKAEMQALQKPQWKGLFVCAKCGEVISVGYEEKVTER